MPAATPRTSTLALCYGSGALQGLAMVALPASATVLQHELGLTSASYGALFLAQTVAAIAGALAAGVLARRRALAPLLAFALAAHALALVALAAATRIDATFAAFTCASALGLGFGVGAVPLNAVPVALGRGPAATTTMHAMVGGGFALGPAIVGVAITARCWVAVPLTLAIVTVIVAALLVRRDLPTPPPLEERTRTVGRRARVGLALVAIGYAFAEGTFS
ncbi:MAG TPA: MFS transporter, partial [Nannocystaceae bacterium]|nr:MFS transporter [Nannocystaceae bacterium]